MSSVSALNSGLQGIQTGLKNLDRDAAKLASADQLSNRSDKDIAESLVNLKEDKLQVQLSAKVVKTASETIGTMLDIFA